MSRVFSSLISPDGTPIQGGSITIDLLWNRSVQSLPEAVDPMYFVEGRWASRSDATGLWEVNLLPNDQISPVGSNAYRITEKPKRYSYFPTIYFIIVPPESATPMDYYVGDIKIDKPDWANP